MAVNVHASPAPSGAAVARGPALSFAYTNAQIVTLDATMTPDPANVLVVISRASMARVIQELCHRVDADAGYPGD